MTFPAQITSANMPIKNTKYAALIGQKFGKLTVIERAPFSKQGVSYRCLCDCGNEHVATGRNLVFGATKSCGCMRSPHKMCYSREYTSWCAMKTRCYRKNSKAYPIYGARGITVCDRWLDSFEAFYEDMGPRPEGTSLERIDNNGNYEPGNCRWATKREQQNNTRRNRTITITGVTKTVAEWVKEFSLNSYGCVRGRLDDGWSPLMALLVPSTEPGRDKTNGRFLPAH